MKRTIKGWCKQYGIDWYGQGNFGTVRYDWKLVFAPGRSVKRGLLKSSDGSTKLWMQINDDV